MSVFFDGRMDNDAMQDFLATTDSLFQTRLRLINYFWLVKETANQLIICTNSSTLTKGTPLEGMKRYT